jgi:hypothetical protein
MTDDEYNEAYEWLLSELRRRSATDLVREIENVVRAGTTREKETIEKRSRATFREPLSPRERLTEGLRVILAAASVPLMLQDAASNMKLSATHFVWAPDFIEDNARMQDTDIAADFQLPKRENLDELARHASAMLSMLTEIQE